MPETVGQYLNECAKSNTSVGKPKTKIHDLVAKENLELVQRWFFILILTWTEAGSFLGASAPFLPSACSEEKFVWLGEQTFI
jgi:hypothetical protein